MASPRTTLVLSIMVLLGFSWLVFFAPRVPGTDERRRIENRILDIRADEVSSIKLRRDRWTGATLERLDEHAWGITEPRAGQAETAMVRELLSGLEFMESARRLQEDEPGQGHRYGFDSPELEIGLASLDGGEIHLAFGREAAVEGGVYLHVQGSGAYHVVPAEILEQATTMLNRLLGVAGDEELP